MDADIINCYSKANVNVENEEKETSVYIGSFLAVGTGKSIINSYNEGNINVSSYNNAVCTIGGLIGYNDSSVYIKNVYNKGNIILKNGKGNIGGLIGCQNSSNNSQIKSAYNTGNIITDKERETNVGSIYGSSNAEISENLINVYELDGITIEGKVIYNNAEKKSKEYMMSENFKNDLGENWKRRENDYPTIDDSEIGIQINYIEDLIELSNNINSSIDSNSKLYRVPIYINRTLDFEEEESYKNFDDISYGDLNGNGTVETIKEELTNKECKGFTPINKKNMLISPIIYGQNNEIKNLYMNNSDGNNLAFIGSMACGKIEGLTVSGNIIAKKRYSNIGGIIGYAGILYSAGGYLEIRDCHNKINIISSEESSAIGGICGNSYANIIIKNCSNSGNISATKCDDIGGIIGAVLSNDSKNNNYIYNCYNNGKISFESRK